MAKIHFSDNVASPDELVVLETRETLTDKLNYQPTLMFVVVTISEGVYQTVNKTQIKRIE